MMRNSLKRVLTRRAVGLSHRLLPHLPDAGTVLDVGSGTGHLAQTLEHNTTLKVVEVDVEDMHVVGPGPVLFDGQNLPFDTDTFSAALVLFVLQYPPDPTQLLQEIARVTVGPIIVIQSVYTSTLGRAALNAWEFCTGRFAFSVSRAIGLIDTTRCPLAPKRLFTRDAFRTLVRDANLMMRSRHPKSWTELLISRDLYVLTREKQYAR